MYGYEGDRWVAYFWFVGWDCLSLGVSLCFGAPNVEVHLPFGFIRLGRKPKSRGATLKIDTKEFERRAVQAVIDAKMRGQLRL